MQEFRHVNKPELLAALENAETVIQELKNKEVYALFDAKTMEIIQTKGAYSSEKDGEDHSENNKGQD